MSVTPPFDPLMLLLDDPALLAALLAPPEPDLAAPVAAAAPSTAPQGPATILPQASVPAMADAPGPAAPASIVAPVPDDAFPTIAELDAMLAESYLPEPGLDAAMRQELVTEFGLDPALVGDEAALLAALAALQPPPEDDLPELLSAEPTWDPSWSETAREDWPLG
jgi:hypothetical protein